MKKARIMLMAIAAVAVVGGALAFKASKFNTRNVYCVTTSVAGVLTCDAFKTIYATTNLGDPNAATTTAPCTDATITTIFPTLSTIHCTDAQITTTTSTTVYTLGTEL